MIGDQSEVDSKHRQSFCARSSSTLMTLFASAGVPPHWFFSTERASNLPGTRGTAPISEKGDTIFLWKCLLCNTDTRKPDASSMVTTPGGAVLIRDTFNSDSLLLCKLESEQRHLLHSIVLYRFPTSSVWVSQLAPQQSLRRRYRHTLQRWHHQKTSKDRL